MIRTRKFVATTIAAGLVFALTAEAGLANHPGHDQHVIYFQGVSALGAGCEYEWFDAAPAAGIQPERDDLNIPRPILYTDGPRCRDTSPAPGIQPKPCALRSNIGAYPPPDQPAPTGPAAPFPPCLFKNVNSTDNPGEQGCFDVGITSTGPVAGACNISTPSWVYGYCSQTYGGGENGQIQTADGKIWRINRLGFPRYRGVGSEVSGKLTLANTTVTHSYRNTVHALANRPEQLGGCVGATADVTHVLFTGVLFMPAPPVKIIRPRVGFHWCADDIPPLGAAGTEGC